MRRVLSWILAALALLILAAGGYISQYFLGQHIAIPGTPYTLSVAPGVSREDVEIVRRGLEVADTYFQKKFGRTTSNPITVRLTVRVPCDLFDDTTGIATPHRLCLYVGKSAWKYLKRQDPVNVLGTVIHEHFHNLQGQLGCLTDGKARQYAWYIEGSATYYSWDALIEAKLISPREALERQRRFAATKESLQPLSAYENSMGGDKAYFLASRAVGQLEQRAGGRGFVHFCTTAKPDWHQAFKDAFGLTTEGFYAQISMN